MSPVGRGSAPVPGPQTHPLNVGAQTTVPAATIIGFKVYTTLANGSTFYPVFGSEVLTFSGFYEIIQASSAFGNAPTSNTAGIASPTTAPTATPDLGGTMPVGTYQVAYTFVTPLGETGLSPATTVTLTSGHQQISAFSPYTFPFQATTGYTTVQIEVPRLENWHVTRYAVLAGSPVSTPSAFIYIDSVTPVNLLDSTALGGQNSGNADLYLRPGQIIFCRWTAADAGALVTLSIFGEKTTGLR